MNEMRLHLKLLANDSPGSVFEYRMISSEMNTYSIDTAKRIFHAFCMEEWIQEEYVPSQVYKHRVQRQETIKQQHQKFCEFIATGDVLDNHSVPEHLMIECVGVLFPYIKRLFQTYQG